MKQKETVLNLHNSGILPEVIAMQLDISKEEVIRIINDTNVQDQGTPAKQASASLDVFYLDALVNIDNIIKSAQLEMWKSLKSEMEFNISTEDTQNALAKLAGSKVTLVILYIDIVGSTRLSMTLPVDKLAAIVRAFTHEMSLIVSAYGGYVLKYLGDAILAFFVAADKSNMYIPCSNAVNCARSMIRAVKEGFNPLLNQEGYPELGVRVGIDVGEVVVVQYGWNVQSSGLDNDNSIVMKKPHHDILGYTISVASKITGIAEPNQIVIGQYVYDALDKEQRDAFKQLSTPEMWNYVSSKTGKLYNLYGPST
ncbi:MAG: adenylate/guanylate cyclase domain-containing protein [Nitrososphaera sp.]|uniref:adenylate/guanylate cyclase domain-containing protein n=1 Tax=Nitrososphaera sp. TaxID=1971748 RepID=UPI00178F699D|nr:adenylate/guanylate cyclase domain-containing protein [Nitrososphaera sp.]NWG36225.1 adenylate/guanylate cyclase domain-containing protein [Nitrososphaera sp.]